jgi:hypothetical protein
MRITKANHSKPDSFTLSSKRRIAWLNLVLLSLFLAAPILGPFLSTSQACCTADTITTQVVSIDGIEVTATIFGGKLFGVTLSPGLFCAAAVLHGTNVIDRVIGFQTEEVGGVSRFNFMPDPTGSIAGGFFVPTTGGPSAEGFFSPIPPNGIPEADAGKPVNFHLRIRLKRNATFNEIRADLAIGKLGLGKASRANDGTFTVLNNEHKVILSLGEITLAQPPAGAPTLSEWGMIIMGLLVVSTAIGFIVRHNQMTIRAGTVGGAALYNPGFRQTLFKPSLFIKVLAGMLVSVLIGLAIFSRLFGPISTTDIGGTLVSAPILAYVIHLLILAARNTEASRE